MNTLTQLWFTTLAVLLGAAVSGVGQEAPAGMVTIPEGVYRPLFRGQTDVAEVRVAAFCLDALPVTNGDYLDFVRANPRWQQSQVKRIFADETYLKHWAGDLEPGTNAPLDAPVVYVSWFAARAFAQWKGKRLPTVAEWEYAASAGLTQVDGRKDREFKRQIINWYSTPAPASLGAVGKEQANFWGVHNMHGLVWEWVADFNTAMVTGDARGDTGIDRQLFCGAGTQNSRDTLDYPAFMRYGFRSSLQADYSVHNLGFRCAKNL
jgi:sulfatase modifying factor 1